MSPYFEEKINCHCGYFAFNSSAFVFITTVEKNASSMLRFCWIGKDKPDVLLVRLVREIFATGLFGFVNICYWFA